MGTGKSASSSPPEVADYIEFYSDNLKNAHHLIYIAITEGMSDDYQRASDAAKSFENVTVINSECISSATGILVMIACKLAQQSMPVEDVVEELETVKKRIKCSFVIGSTEYMSKKGFVSKEINTFANTLGLHPSFVFKNDRPRIGGIWLGDGRHVYRSYIRQAFPVDIIPDSDVAFITYADVSEEMLLWIREEISRYAYFEHVVFQQASAAISSNCGPGTVGILYFVKGNKTYNVASLLPTSSVYGENDENDEKEEMEYRESYREKDAVDGSAETGDEIELNQNNDIQDKEDRHDTTSNEEPKNLRTRKRLLTNGMGKLKE